MDCPEVLLNNKNGILELYGNIMFSFEEQINLLNWLSEYVLNPFSETTLNLKIGHIDGENFLVSIFRLLEKLSKVKILWCFDKENDDLREYSMYISQKTTIIFEFIEF